MLDDLLAELARVSALDEVVVIGSQCVHAVTDRPPPEVVMSIECDVLFDEGELSERVDAALGKTSAYQAEHGVYVDTVPATFPFLPPGWEARVRTLEVPGLRARCLELHDLCVSKLAAGRLKDSETVAALITEGLVDPHEVQRRIMAVEDLRMRAILLARLQILGESLGR